MQFYFHLPRGNEYKIGEHSKIYSQNKLVEFEHIGASYHYIMIMYAKNTFVQYKNERIKW